jgi:hypothetical protein
MPDDGCQMTEDRADAAGVRQMSMPDIVSHLSSDIWKRKGCEGGAPPRGTG